MDLEKILPLLVASKVSKFKYISNGEPDDYCIELELNGGSTEALTATIKAQEQALPADLRADDLMNHDKVMNWSAPPAADEPDMPLTDEKPL